jgi:hypothetical protein
VRRRNPRYFQAPCNKCATAEPFFDARLAIDEPVPPSIVSTQPSRTLMLVPVFPPFTRTEPASIGSRLARGSWSTLSAVAVGQSDWR